MKEKNIKIRCRACDGTGCMTIFLVDNEIRLVDCLHCKGKGFTNFKLKDNRIENKTPIKKLLEDIK